MEVAAARPVSSFRRSLQREHLRRREGLVLRRPEGAPEDERSLARADLEAIGAAIDALDLSAPDAMRQALLRQTRARIGAILAAGPLRQT